ncbi:DUF2207 domain-containing protein [Sphingomonas sp. HDW15A]|uniref:DUF2207 domain-containing protein n=1 Tax=Sphingomonas sp. HDW15A TaxID=2714942 RepID=UPI00140B9318|nr:DUF2207 domain-containing protein [Sphingomonas sp. HDW15A]QIK96055.1 DUF2207 domain-containing protein [Sphingomonas sp. HDW15A]
MRRLLAAFALLLALAAPAAAEERILSFDSTVAIQPDASLDVTETIRVNAENVQINRGIYRDFPTRYKGRHGERIRVGFELLETTRDGQPEPNKVEGRGNGVRIYLGDPDQYVPVGEHVYTIRYRATRMLGRFDAFDEIYWNVTGNGWVFPIDRATATITLPSPASFFQPSAYTGPQGSDTGRGRVIDQRPGSISFATTAPLGSYEGFTVAAAFPKDVVPLPPSSTRLGWLLSDVAPPAFAGAGLMVVLGFLMTAYRRAGRDPPEGTVVPIFSPPDDLSPAAMRYVTEQSFDDRAFAAAIIDSAVKGHVRLEEESGLLGFGKKRYLVGTETTGAKPLDAAEGSAIAALVSPGERLEMDNEHHATFSAAKKLLSDSFDKRFAGSAFNRNTGWAAAAVGVWALAMLLTVAAVAYGEGMASASWAFLPGALLLLAFLAWKLVRKDGTAGCLGKAVAALFTLAAVMTGFPLFPLALSSGNWIPIVIAAVGLPLALSSFFWISAPTKAGRGMLDRIAGFKQYLSITERERLDRMQAPDDTLQLFEKYLPYAIALDVENRWADRFASQLAAASAAAQASGSTFGWYSGTSDPWNDPGGFVDSVGSSLSNSISSASTAPGSSSGSGGGGSSGGGGGGGGGGGW